MTNKSSTSQLNQETNIVLSSFVPDSMFKQRLDQVLANLFPDYSRSKLKEWIQEGYVSIDGNILSLPRHKVLGGEEIRINAVQDIQVSAKAQSIELDVIFEDEELLVLNKPMNLVVHPGAGNSEGTVLNALLAHCPEVEMIPRAGIVHRLDKDTTGLMVVAKTLTAHTHLVDQLQKRTMGREYEAVVTGEMIAGGTVNKPISRHPQKRTAMAVVESGKPAVTHYRILNKYQHYTHLRLKLETGRTHQIRVHMSSIKHPIVGDTLYAGRPRLPKHASDAFIEFLRTFNRQALHAAQLQFEHPVTNELLRFTAQVPEDMKMLIEHIKAYDVSNNKNR